MKVDDIRVEGETLAFVTCTLDGVRCDAREERVGYTDAYEPVVRETRHPSSVVCRGADVPAEIVSALTEAQALSRSVGVPAEECGKHRIQVVEDPHFLARD
jgi:hypothetical protein